MRPIVLRMRRLTEKMLLIKICQIFEARKNNKKTVLAGESEFRKTGDFQNFNERRYLGVPKFGIRTVKFNFEIIELGFFDSNLNFKIILFGNIF